MTLEQITDHVARGAETMISQYHDKANINSVLASYTAMCQDAENMLWDVLLSHLLDNATGGRLDTVGKIVGQPRKGTNDTQYRLYIQARIRVNRSNGKVEDLVGLIALLLSDYTTHYVPKFPASAIIEVLQLDESEHSPDVLAELFCDAIAGGVACSLHWSAEGTNEFQFAPGSVEVSDADHGFENVAGTNGGQWLGARI